MSRLLIVNPFASGVDEHRLAAVQAALPAGTETQITTAAGEASELARAASGVEAVYVLGGDGTYNEVLNGLESRRAAGLPARRRHERASARARPSARPGRGGEARGGGAHTPDRRRARQRPAIRLQRGARLRRRARPARRRARTQPGRATARGRRVHARRRVVAHTPARALRRAARDRGRRPCRVRARRELLAVHVLGLARARPRSGSRLRRGSRLLRPGERARARPSARAGPRRPRVGLEGRDRRLPPATSTASSFAATSRSRSRSTARTRETSSRRCTRPSGTR